MTDPEEPVIDIAPRSQLAADAPPAERRGAKGAIIIGARIATGLVGIGVALVVVAAATWLPLPTRSVSPPSSLVTPAPTDRQLACAGPLLRLGNDQGQSASTASSIAPATVTSASSAGTISTSRLSTTNNAYPGPQVATLASQGGTGALFAASQVAIAQTQDSAGLAAAACAEGTGDSWLVGGATDTGRTTLLSLANPSQVASTVTIQIWSETGPVTAAGSNGIVVPAGGQRVLSLAGFAPGITSPVVRVTSRGGQVVATLQESIVRTLTPGGVDIIAATSAPTTKNVISGIVVSNSLAVIAGEGAPGSTDLKSVVRLFTPGTNRTSAAISVTPEDGTVPAKAATVAVEPGRVNEFPIGDLADGSYTVTVSSAEPVVAAVRVSTIGSNGLSDFTWVGSSAPVLDSQLVVLAGGPNPAIHISNPTAAAMTATIGSGATAVTVAVPAGGSIAVPLAPGSYPVSGIAGSHVAVSYIGDSLLAAYPIGPPEPVSTPIRVFS